MTPPKKSRTIINRTEGVGVSGAAAIRAISGTLRAGAERYDRARHLPWLARATPAEIASADPETTRSIVERLARALRAERRRGRARHWTYDMNRHIALLQALKAERKRLGRVTRSRRENVQDE